MIRIGKYGSIDKEDAICIGICFLAVFFLTLLWGCGSKAETDKLQPSKEKVLGNDNYEIDTVTLVGHRYFLIRGSFGNTQLQHEESCKIRDIKSLEKGRTVKLDILKSLTEEAPKYSKIRYDMMSKVRCPKK